jgi:hypothetical protein
MNNYRLTTADRLTHIKIVTVALIACVAIVSAGKAAHQELSATSQAEVRAQMKVAEKPVLWTSAGRIIR